MPNRIITSLTLSGVVIALMASAFRGAAADPNNLTPWGDYEHGWFPGAGKKLANGSWDGSTALEASTGTPWFSIRFDQKLFTSIRGQWLKLYFDSKGGSVGIIWMDVATRECANLPSAGAGSVRKDVWGRLAGTFKMPDQDMEKPTLLIYGGGALYDNFRLYRLGTEPPELLEPFTKHVPNPDLISLVTDTSFESATAGPQAPPGGSRWTRSYKGPYGPKLQVPTPSEKYNYKQ